MTPEQKAAVRTCAEWVGWNMACAELIGETLCWRGDSETQSLADLWEACRAKLCDEARRYAPDHAERTIWWDEHSRNAGWRTPLENLEALAEVLK